MKKKKISLNYIIFIAITMVAVATILSFWFLCNRKFSGLITERAVDDYAETTVAVQKNVDTLVSYTEDFAKYMSLDERVQSLLEEYNGSSVENRVKNAAFMYNEWEEISVQLIYSTSRVAGFGVYSDNELLYSFFNSATSYDTDIISKKSLEQAKQQKKPLWTDLLTLESSGVWFNKEEYVFSVLKYVQGEHGKRLGTIVLFVRESSFSDILSNADDTRTRQFYLTDTDGMVVSAENKECLYRDVKEAVGLTDDQYEVCLEKGQLLLEHENEAPVLYMSSEIAGTNFRLVGRTVLQELQVQRKDFSMFMQMILVAILGVAILASWFVSKQVTKPLNRIIGVMKQIESGQNKEKLRCPEDGMYELSQLGEEFNRLMDKVDESAGQIYQEQRQRRHNEVRLLQAQIIPHFLYNTLGMISALIKLNRASEAQEAIQNLASFYRLSLSGGNEKITVAEEMELTKNYLALQKMRYIEYVQYTVVHDERTSDFVIPKLTIQPLVENVLNHGLNPNGMKCTIVIKTKYDEANNTCIISVSDNGQGISPERLAQIRESLQNERSITKSFGLLNIYQRMKLLYGDKFTMQVDSMEGKFTKFTLCIRREEKA